jgi:hypothetical protein
MYIQGYRHINNVPQGAISYVRGFKLQRCEHACKGEHAKASPAVTRGIRNVIK